MKATSRLTALHIHIIGVTATIICAAILFFLLIKPKVEDTKTVLASADSIEGSGGTPEKVAAHKKDLGKAKATAVETNEKWLVNDRKYMPGLNFNGDLLDTYENKLIKIPSQWGQWVAAWYDGQRNLGVSRFPGVEFPIDAFPADPNSISELSSLRFPRSGFWNVGVEAKSFDQAMAHLKRFNNMERHGMPVIDNISLSGQSPNLSMSYTLALYIIPSADPPVADPVISAPAGGAAGGLGMGRRGMMGGMGGPGGMMGGAPMMGGGPMMGGPGGAGGMMPRGGAGAGAPMSGAGRRGKEE